MPDRRPEPRSPQPRSPEQETNRLESLINRQARWLILTGAGCSAPSGIPTYRDDAGTWQRNTPIQHQDFIRYAASRQRYWARSFAGWPAVAKAKPNVIHDSIKQLEDQGRCDLLVTQNVDRLHQRAGHKNVIDLHGRLDRVVCLDCHHEITRDDMQLLLADANPGLSSETLHIAPDGDAEVSRVDIKVPDCDHCGGVLMPRVVFYGGGVKKTVVQQIESSLDQAGGLIIVGSSVMVFSSFRFCRQAHRNGQPILIINPGKTRADEMASFKLHAAAEQVLPLVVDNLAAERPTSP